MDRHNLFREFEKSVVAGLTKPNWATQESDLQPLDRVRLSSGQVLIVTKHTGRPANCWAGVLENGHGKEYIFGPKHRPVKVGVAHPDHPALRHHSARQTHRQDSAPDNTTKTLIGSLLGAVEAGDFDRAKVITKLLREAGL